MTPTALVIMGAYLAIHGIETLADWLDMRRLKAQSPEDAADVYDVADYARMQAHTAATTRLGLVESSTMLAVFLGFWLAGGFGWLADWCAAVFGQSLWGGLAFAGLLYLGARLVRLPFSLHHTFVIEQRFGFNKMTLGLFAADAVKSLLVTAVIGGGIFALLVLALELGGGLGWLIAWGVVVAFGALLMVVGPTLILPLFNKFKKLSDGPLRDRVLALAGDCGFPLKDIYVMDGSRRSTRANAFFAGLGRGRRVVLFDTLVNHYSVDELVAVLAHEIGHWKLRHLPRRLVWSALSAGVGLWVASWAVLQPELYATFGVDWSGTAWVPVGLVLFSIAVSPVNWLAGILSSARSRRHEYEADQFAVSAVGEATALSGALVKLSRDNLANLDPHPMVVSLHYSHPPLRHRIEALARAGQSLLTRQTA